MKYLLKLLIFIIYFSNVTYSQHTQFNLLNFGGKGNGFTDNYEAFVKALDAASRVKNSVIFIPAGRYIISRQIPVISNFIIAGEQGTILEVGENVKNNLFFNKAADISIHIKNINFVIPNPDVSLTNLFTFHKATVVISDCKFNISKPLIFKECFQITIRNSQFNNQRSQMPAIVYIFSSSNILIKDNSILSTGGITFVNGCSKIQILNNSFGGISNAYPLHFDLSRSPDKYHSKILIQGNTFSGNLKQAHKGGTFDQISCFGTDKIIIKNNIVNNGGDMGITVSKSKMVLIERNLCQQNHSSGISIDNVKTCIIADNKLLNNGIKPDNNLRGMPESRTGLFIVNNSHSKIDSLILARNEISNINKKFKVYSVSIIDKKNLKGIYALSSDKQNNDQINNYISGSTLTKVRSEIIKQLGFVGNIK